MGLKTSCLLALATAATLACMDQPETAMQPSEVTAEAQSPAILLAAGDIAGCAEHYRDEVTARFVEPLPGTIALLGGA